MVGTFLVCIFDICLQHKQQEVSMWRFQSKMSQKFDKQWSAEW